MDTISPRVATAAVPGARHLRTGRNGQDAAVAWLGAGRAGVVVCDGCGSGASSEVGARLGAQLAIQAIAEQLAAGRAPSTIWDDVRTQVAATLAQLVDAMPGERGQIVEDHFLFTIVAAAWSAPDDEVAVWALGDGGYALGDREIVLGPFPDNQPPYLGYDLLDGAPASVAHLDVASACCGSVVVATDGAVELGLDTFSDTRRYFANPDALRRHLAVLARGSERVDWNARKVERQPAALQDDGAVAILRWAR